MEGAMGIETSRTKLVTRLEGEGWELIRSGAEHDVYRHPTKSGTIVVPRHRTLSTGVARHIVKTAGWK
jgi:predicted RNA binding protein YcfA (HicA-like mRNA interferase family)